MQTPDFTFDLGRIKFTNDAHDEELQKIARWLDENKFSCTYSVVEGRALFDVAPHDEDKDEWARRPLFSRDGFVLYAAEYIINSLSRALGEKNGTPS